jgi:hypothetical protein
MVNTDSSKWQGGALLVVIAALLGWNLWLTRPSRRAGAEPSPKLRIGKVMPAFVAYPLGGRSRVPLPRAARPEVIYVFRPGCVWCQRNAPNLADLVVQRSPAYDFIAVSSEKITAAECGEERKLGMSVYYEPAPRTLAAYRITGTPQTFVLDARNRLLASWDGAYGNAELASVEAFFGLTLPGLKAAAP